MISIIETDKGDIIYDSLDGVYGADGKYGFKWFEFEKQARDYLDRFYIDRR